ncbi:MAG TPA: OmpA family protein [Polyangiaceae bacterium]|jgi:outer membrane protein OmpA-like peptidoglycan-associated protein
MVHRIDRRAAALGVALCAVGLARGASAQSTPNVIPKSNGDGLDTHLFRPAMDSKGIFTVNGTDILGNKEISLGLVLDYAHTLLRTATTSPLIEHSFQGTFQFSYGIANQIIVGVDVPIDLMSGPTTYDGNGQAQQAGWGPTKLDFQGVGDVAVHAKWRILKVERGFGLAIGVQGGGGLSDAAANAGADSGFWYWPILAVEKRFGPSGQFRIALNGGYRGHSATGTVLALNHGRYADGDLATYGGGISWRVLESLDLAAETYGTVLTASGATGAIADSNEVVGGIKVFVERNSYFMLGGGTRYGHGFEAADERAFVGFVFEPSIGDRDGDGIKDDVDQCPDDPEDFDGFKDEDGCPDPDNDNDGIPDVDDRCPNVPEDREGDHDEDGCPEQSDGDRDGDGIPDSKDQCPDEPEDRDGFQDEDGCPDPDNDRDGIPDKVDQCPNDPEDKDGFQDEDGCPDPDNDQDGIPDVRDKCPNDPETYNGFEDEDGCPDKGSVIIQDNNIIILEKIKFRTDSAEILPESNRILDAVATTLAHHPEFLLLEIAGHADERASDEHNLKLTQDRVNSVMRALIARGIEQSRLRSKGYGEFCPDDPGHTPAAWEKNRRVEFKIIKTKDGPTGVELGCDNASKHGVDPDPIP